MRTLCGSIAPLPTAVPSRSGAPSMVQLMLAPGLHHCECDGICIFLDVSRDRYFCLSDTQSDWFRQIMDPEDTETPPDKVKQFRTSLIRQGVLVERCRPAHPIPGAHAGQTLRNLVSYRPAGASSGQWIRVARAVAGTWWLQRQERFEGVAGHVAGLKAKLAQRADDTAADWELLTAQFLDLAPYFFTSDEACRFRSIALIKFLAFCGVASDWVFGVRLAPFGAHCWVEKGPVVLNDEADRIREFKPILRI